MKEESLKHFGLYQIRVTVRTRTIADETSWKTVMWTMAMQFLGNGKVKKKCGGVIDISSRIENLL